MLNTEFPFNDSLIFYTDYLVTYIPQDMFDVQKSPQCAWLGPFLG